MKKTFLFISLFLLFLSFTSVEQDSDKKLLFCKQFFSAESLLKLSMKYNDNEENSNLFIIEANKAAVRAQSLLDGIEPSIKTKLTTEELKNLKMSVKFINDRTSQGGSFDQETLMKITLWFQLSENKLNPIFAKLMK